MTKPASSVETRREALRSVLRWLAAGALALTGGWLALHRGSGGVRCDLACRGCPRLRRCARPEAEAQRQARPRG